MSDDRKRIGIFDSGVGGLTVLSALYRQLPDESYLYFGDTARLPYGTRSAAEIVQFMREILTMMKQERVKMAIVACNTSAALALDIVRSEFDFPILGPILPGAKAAVREGRRIGTIATPATAQSGTYRRAMLEADATVKVWEVGCPEFVPIVEGNRLHEPQTYQIARSYLEPLLRQRIDTLVYGCTHYPHLAPVLNAILPPTVKLVDPAISLAEAAARELDLLGLRAEGEPLPTRFGVSGCPDRFAQLSVQWLGFTPFVSKVSLPQVSPGSVPLPQQ
ncbi:glutamate racemase [Oscillatoriales cyanobacterium LEGE 11467]|uniref:Glutamate racemase n=1 Tax=Zarconia navalis LEGE 11467 TaxID=1828826 RepID=A0A928VX10_9CYAN|nr:glutamate racemase [Zarconia navalis]MBE9039225.1 glutamate racemase [Zarconia navalis LEGE 11467]